MASFQGVVEGDFLLVKDKPGDVYTFVHDESGYDFSFSLPFRIDTPCVMHCKFDVDRRVYPPSFKLLEYDLENVCFVLNHSISDMPFIFICYLRHYYGLIHCRSKISSEFRKRTFLQRLFYKIRMRINSYAC
jgi:hypothetical protein